MGPPMPGGSALGGRKTDTRAPSVGARGRWAERGDGCAKGFPGGPNLVQSAQVRFLLFFFLFSVSFLLLFFSNSNFNSNSNFVALYILVNYLF